MARFMDNLAAINSFLRTLMAMIVLGAAGTASYLGYTTYAAKDIAAKRQQHELDEQKRQLSEVSGQLDAAKAELVNRQRALEAKDAEITKLNDSLKKLELALRYLKVDHRVARFTAIDQSRDEATGEVTSLIEFVELNDEGQPIDTPRQYRIRGDIVYIDGWVVKFDDKYVEQADLERGTSLLLFRRIFGSGQKPDDGFALDEIGFAPRAYAREGKVSDFEKKIWDEFWEIANDSDRARKLGIRAAHGGAPFMRVEKGKSYKILLRSSGDPTIVPEETPVVGTSS